jgi:hypothetical protein
LLFRDAEELHERLLRLVAMPELARAIGDAARDYVMQERMLAYQVADRIAWYRDLWDRRDELHSALLARLVSVRTQVDEVPADPAPDETAPDETAQEEAVETAATV